MAFVRLQTEIITPNWNYSGAVAYLRVFASQSFYEASSGQFIAQGRSTDINSFCQKYSCAVSGTQVTLPNVTLATTTDSSVPNVTYDIWLYDSSNVPRFNLLSQGYVDPNYFQVLSQSSVICTLAGTTSVNGVYTYRGQSVGFGYYNLDGQAASLTANVIKVSGGAWIITNGAGVTQYTGLDMAVSYPWETLYEESAGSLPAPTVAEDDALLISTWEALRNSNQGSMPWPQPQNEYWTIPQTKEFVLRYQSPLAYSAELQAGKTELDVDPDISTQPIAIGVNSPIIAPISASVYVNPCTQAGLDAAIAEVGSDVRLLYVTCPVTVTTNTTTPVNCVVAFTGKGGFSVNGGVTLTIKSMMPPTSYQVFAGSGDAVFGENAVPYLDIAWWAGPSAFIAPIANADHAFAQAKTSIQAGNGPLRVGSGVWKITNWVLPNDCVVQGAGSSTNAGDKTIIQLQNTGSSVNPKAVMRVNEDFRNVVIRDLTISVGSATTASCFICSGSVPNSGINLTLENVTFHGTGSTSKPQFYIFDADGAHAWECTNVRWYNCQWSTPASTKSVHCDTVNSTFLLVDPQVNNAGNSTFWYGEYTGWPEVVGTASFRGVSGLTPVTTTDRSIKCTVSVGTKNVTVTTGTISLNDVGQQVTFDNGVFTQTTNITGITSATTFTIEDIASHTFTTSDTDVDYYSPDPAGARAVWHLVHAHNSIQIENSVDEGYQYYLINDSSDNNSPFNINGGIIQAIVQLNGAMVLNVNGCRLRSQLFEDINGIEATIGMAVPNSMGTENLWGVNLLKPRVWGVNNGTTAVPVNFSYQYNSETFATTRTQSFGIPTHFLQDIKHAGALTTPLQFTGAADVTNGGPHKALIAWGRLEPTSEIPDYFYWLARDYDTGFTLFVGNQAFPNRGYDFDGTVYAQTFNGDELTPATITSNQDNYIPANSSYVYRLATNATRHITGLALSGTSLFSELGGEIHEIWNVGTQKLVIDHQNAGSSVANRFLCDIGGNITVSPNERCFLTYDGTVSRWRVSKGNITGVNSDGAAIDLAIPVTMEDTLEVQSDVTMAATLTVASEIIAGAALDFRFDLNPSDSNTGLALLGNPSNIHVQVDEAADTVEIEAGDVTISGTTGITGDTTVTGALRGVGTSGIGYATGSGSTVTQITSKSTTVVLSKVCGTITMHNAALGAGTVVTFAFTNTCITSTDQLILSHQSGGTFGAYIFNSQCGSGTANVNVTNISGGSLSEAVVIKFDVFKSVNS